MEKLKIDFPEIHTTSHSKGLLIEAPQHDIISLELIFESGKIHELLPGISYFTIKMLQEGTKERSGEDILFALESLGSFLEANSGLERTSLKLYSLKKHFDASLEIIREILYSPVFPEKELEILKSVRKKQIENQLAKNNHFATLKFNELFFGAEHPIGRMPGPKMVEAIGIEDVHNYYSDQLFSAPKFILAGNYEPSDVDKVDALIGGIAAQSNDPVQLGVISSEGSHHINRPDSSQCSIRIGARTISRHHPDIHKLNISTTLLGGFFGSRLMQNIREKKGLTYGIYATNVNTSHENYWLIGSELARDKVEEAESEIIREIEILSQNAPSDEETAVLKNYLRGKLLTSLDSVFGRMSVFKKIFLDGVDHNFLNDYLETVNNTTPEMISESTARYYDTGKSIRLIVG